MVMVLKEHHTVKTSQWSLCFTTSGNWASNKCLPQNNFFCIIHTTTYLRMSENKRQNRAKSNNDAI